MTTNNLFDSLMAAEMKKNEKAGKAGEESTRQVYDPKGNSHWFNKGFAPPWWGERLRQRNLGADGVDAEFQTDPMVGLRKAGGDFDLALGKAGTQIGDDFVANVPVSYNLLRTDTNFVLRTGLNNDSPVIPYSKIVILPDNIAVSLQDFLLDENPDDLKRMNDDQKAIYNRQIATARERSQKIKDFLEKNNPGMKFDKEDVSVPLNQILKPAGCNVWRNGRSITLQYFVGTMEPRPGDVHRVFLNVEAATDGSKSTRYYLTIVRVVCENTQAHAEADGWAKLTNIQKDRQSMRIRRTSKMEQRLSEWHNSIVDVLMGAVEVMDVFSQLAGKQIAENKAKRDAIIRTVIIDQFDLEKTGKNGTVSKRTQNRLDEILEAVYADKFGGGKDCLTYFDLYNGITNYQSNFKTVNGLDNLADKMEKRLFLNLTDDITIGKNQSVLQAVVALAA